MIPLMELAWEHSRDDITKIVWIELGCLSFLFVFLFSISWHLTAGMIAADTIGISSAFLLGLADTIIFTSMLCIVVIIFEYCLSLSWICYRYYLDVFPITLIDDWIRHIRIKQFAQRAHVKYQQDLKTNHFLEEIRKLKEYNALDDL